MAYGVHIERPDGQQIELEEWQQAVATTAGVRLAGEEPLVVEVPSTGSRIISSYRPGDAELFDPALNNWVPAFRLFEGRVTSAAARDFDDASCNQRVIMRALAGLLGAQVVGDEGEIYE